MPSEAVKHRRALYRAAHPRLAYREDAKFGLFTLIRPDYTPSAVHTRAHGGWWIAKCQCGKLCRVHTRDLRLQSRKGYSCSDCPPPPGYYEMKNAGEDKRIGRAGRPPLDLVGKVSGRFTFLSWFPGIGWQCQCETCGGTEVIPNSNLAFRRSMIGCDGTCVVPD